MRNHFIMTSMLALALAGWGRADVVTLQSGEKVQCEVTEMTGANLQVKVARKNVALPRSTIKSIEFESSATAKAQAATQPTRARGFTRSQGQNAADRSSTPNANDGDRQPQATKRPTAAVDVDDRPPPDPDKSVYVRGYYRKDGTYVQPHYRARPGHGKK